MTEQRMSVSLPIRATQRTRVVARIGSWARVPAATMPALVVAVGSLAATGWIAALLLGRVAGLAVPPYDLAFFQQVVWQVGQDGRWVSTFHEGSFLGLHFSPILVVPALVERVIWADVRVLSLFHAAAVGALVPAAFLFLRAVFRPSRAADALAAGLAVGIPVWGAMQGVIRADFHPETAGVGLALLAGWAGLTGRSRTMWALALLALATREDIVYAVFVVGLVVAARGRGDLRRQGRTLAVVAVAWAVIVFAVLIPAIRDGLVSDTARYYAWLGGGLGVLAAPFTMTDRVVAALTRPEAWFVVAGLLVSVVGLPLVRPRWAVLLVPPLLALLLSSHQYQAKVLLHYPLILLVPLLVSAGMGGRRILAVATRLRRRWRRGPSDGQTSAGTPRDSSAAAARPSGLSWRTAVALLVVSALPAFAGGWIQGSLPPFDVGDTAFSDRPAAIDRLYLVAGAVPANARLVADEGLVAPLAGRVAIGSLVSVKVAVPPVDAYVLLDRDAWSSGRWEVRRRARNLEILASSARPILIDDGRFVLLGPLPAEGVP